MNAKVKLREWIKAHPEEAKANWDKAGKKWAEAHPKQIKSQAALQKWREAHPGEATK